MTDSAAGTTTTTAYVGRLETHSITTSSGPTTITTTDYAAAGKVLAESVNGTLSYLATSYQGSVVEALDGSGMVGVTASQLYAPYGGVRSSSGAMPTDYGYTGQRSDASTGLDDYGARYYDPTLGQFTSADTWLAGGLNRYGYVGGNPTTNTDPSGHALDKHPDEGGMEGASNGEGGGGGGIGAALLRWLFGIGEDDGAAAASSTVTTTTTTTDGALVIDEGSDLTATIDDGGITFTNTETGDSEFFDNSYFNDVEDPATQTPGSHYWNSLDDEANELEPPQTTTEESGTPENPVEPSNAGNGPTAKPPQTTDVPESVPDNPIPNPRGRAGIRVWRAVDQTELDDIKAQGQFRNPLGNESKWFSTTREGAVKYGELAYKAMPQEGIRTLVSGRFPYSQITPGMLAEVDQGIPALVIPSEELSQIYNITIWGAIIP